MYPARTNEGRSCSLGESAALSWAGDTGRNHREGEGDLAGGSQVAPVLQLGGCSAQQIAQRISFRVEDDELKSAIEFVISRVKEAGEKELGVPSFD